MCGCAIRYVGRPDYGTKTAARVARSFPPRATGEFLPMTAPPGRVVRRLVAAVGSCPFTLLWQLSAAVCRARVAAVDSCYARARKSGSPPSLCLPGLDGDQFAMLAPDRAKTVAHLTDRGVGLDGLNHRGRRFSSPRAHSSSRSIAATQGCGVAIGPHALHSLALATFALRSIFCSDGVDVFSSRNLLTPTTTLVRSPPPAGPGRQIPGSGAADTRLRLPRAFRRGPRSLEIIVSCGFESVRQALDVVAAG